jgi:pilus assembly protein CpaB
VTAGPDKTRNNDARRSRVRALLFLAAAALAAVGAAVLLTRYMDARVAAVRVPTEKVVVAAVDLPVATPLKPGQLAVVDWPVASLPEGRASDPASLAGKVVTVAVAKGEPILASRIAGSGAGGASALATVLPTGVRAVSVRVDDVVGVAGFIHPGDRVDVLVTMIPIEGSQTPVSKVVLQNIKVLAVGKELESKHRDPQATVSATVATLMVTAAQSERLALGAVRGQILLALRSAVDAEEVETPGVSPPTLYNLSRHEPEVKTVARATRRQPPHAPAPAPAVEPVPAVEIMRGDLFEKRNFKKEVGQ